VTKTKKTPVAAGSVEGSRIASRNLFLRECISRFMTVEALPSQVFQVVAKVIRPVQKGHIRSPKGTVPSCRGLVGTLGR